MVDLWEKVIKYKENVLKLKKNYLIYYNLLCENQDLSLKSKLLNVCLHKKFKQLILIKFTWNIIFFDFVNQLYTDYVFDLSNDYFSSKILQARQTNQIKF